MSNESARSGYIQAKRKVKTKTQWLIGVLLIIIIIAASIFLFFRTLLPSNIGQPTTTFETMKTSLTPKTTSLNIVGLGDSLTAGVGDPEEKGYAGLAVQHLKKSNTNANVSFVDYGIKGDTTDDLLHVLAEKKVQKSIKDTDIIFMTIGGNDLVSVVKENFLDLNVGDFNKKRLTYQRNFNEIIATINKLNPKATIYYLGLYNPFENLFPELDPQFSSVLHEWNKSSQTILELYPNTVFVPTDDLFKNRLSELLYNDHFHPNKEGYQLMSERLVKMIQKGDSPQLTKK
ncbi:MAG: SGNH/GDSL hydrolase family protein [Tuberibacillus sp.]